MINHPNPTFKIENLLLREAVKEDCPALLKLIKELAAYEKAPLEVTVLLSEFEETGFGEKPIWKAFVAEMNQEIVGMSLFYDRYSTWKGKKLYLEDLVVTEKLRSFGIGKKLFDKTLEYAKEFNYKGMVWQVLDWNEPAIAFYKKYQAHFDGEWLNGSIDF